MKHLLFFFACVTTLLYTNTIFSQQVMLSGTVSDSINQPIPNTNIIATPIVPEHSSPFAITDQQGRYQLLLDKNITYVIDIIQLGYAKLHDTIRLTQDVTKNYTLQPGRISLAPVILESEMAVVVKEDTITYRTDQFKTGDERKLRDILAKLPGVEVDREGNVTVNGQNVTTLLVDGKDFFGGDTKLGVNNIPSNAVAEVEVIDDYHEVAFMKGLSESDAMAMNIKLKKGKKQFVFWETEAGGGVDERYYVHPTLFYYSPKTTINFIGSLNNTGRAPLTWSDLVRFKGGYSSSLDDPIASENTGLRKFSQSRDLQYQKTEFGAANFTQELLPNLQLTAYTIAAKQKTDYLTTNTIRYLSQHQLQEHRTSASIMHNFSSYSKLKLRYRPDYKTDLAYNLLINAFNGQSTGQLSSQTDSLQQVTTSGAPHNFAIKQYFRYNSQPSFKHTSEIKAKYIYSRQHARADWLFNSASFSKLIPAITDGEWYNLRHRYELQSNKAVVNYKHYWVVNNSNHIYPSIGVFYANQRYHNTDFQQLSNGEIHHFKTAGFNNATNFQLVDPHIGLQYKFKAGRFTFKPGLTYHHYIWRVKQFDQIITDSEKSVFLPEFMGKYTLSNSEEFELNYALKSNFKSVTNYANRLRLVDFNRVFRGNKGLENELYHYAILSYHKFNMYHGLTFFTTLNYSHRVHSVQKMATLEGINQVNTSVYTDFPSNSYGFSGNFSKRWKTYKLSFASRIHLNSYARLINHKEQSYHSQYYYFDLSAETSFDHLPNLELGLTQSYSTSKSSLFRSKFMTTTPYAHLDYAFGNGFILKLDYDYTYYKNLNTNSINRFQIGDASLYYRAESSPWGFEIRAANVFDVRYKTSNSFDEFMIYDRRTYTQPRTVLFILSYHL